jgi:stage III sporulation protein AF
MAWMASWLKELILMILLATFAEMLLPKNTLQRYVKSVLGLFILLTMLSPIFTLLQKQKDVSQMLASASVMDEGTVGAAIPVAARDSSSTLASILEDGGRMRSENMQQTKLMVESGLVRLLNEEALAGARHRAVSVQVDLAENNGEAQIRHMRVLLHAIDSQQETKRPPKEKWTFEPIAPVDVRVAPTTKEQAETRGQAAADSTSDDTSNVRQSTERIMELLKDKLQLHEGQVTLSFDKKAESLRKTQ